MAPLSWWPFLGLVFLLGLLARVYPLAGFAFMMLIISAVALWWKNHALDRLSYRRKLHFKRGYPGESISMQVEVENRKFLPLPWLRILDSIPYAVGPCNEDMLRPTHLPDLGSLVSLFSLRWYERDRRSIELLLRKRGVYRLGPARVDSGDLFGIFEQSIEKSTEDYLTVFPETIPFQALQFPSGDPFGDRRSVQRLYEDPTQSMGVRDYHPEDDFRRIHWPASAHTGILQVKVYQPVSARVLVVCLNAMTLPHYWEGTDPEMLEHLVRISAAIVEHALEDGYRVGMISNSSLAHADQPFRVPPGRSPNQLVNLLSALASVTPFVTGTFERFLVAEAPQIPYGATLMITTALIHDAFLETLIRLKDHGRRIVLLSVGRKAPPGLPGITVHHIPHAT